MTRTHTEAAINATIHQIVLFCSLLVDWIDTVASLGLGDDAIIIIGMRPSVYAILDNAGDFTDEDDIIPHGARIGWIV